MASRVPRPLTSIAPPSITTLMAAPPARPAAPTGQAQPALELARQAAIAPMVVVLGPAVEFPADQTDGGIACRRRLALDDKGRGRVAQPNAIGGRLEEPDSSQVDSHAFELIRHAALHRLAADDDVHRFDAAQVPDDLGIDPRHRRELSGPVVAIVRPRDPGCRVWLPLRGHAIVPRFRELFHT